jgi:hypothetical protein
MAADEKFVAIDRDILLGLSVSLEPHRRAFDFFFTNRYIPMVTPSVWAVIKDTEEKSSDSEARLRAQIIVQDTLDSVTVCPSITETYQQVLDIHADTLLSKGVLQGANKIDALTLLEAIHLDASVLLTTNPTLRDAPSDKLKPALIECGLPTIYIVSPKQINEYLDFLKAPKTMEKSGS